MARRARLLVWWRRCCQGGKGTTRKLWVLCVLFRILGFGVTDRLGLSGFLLGMPETWDFRSVRLARVCCHKVKSLQLISRRIVDAAVTLLRLGFRA